MSTKPGVTVGSRWREKESGATFVVVEVRDDGRKVWCRWEETGTLWYCDGTDFYLWNRFAPLDRGQTW